MHRTVLCYDSFFLTNLNLVQFLHENSYEHLKNGVLAPVLRDSTLVNGKLVPVNSMTDVHKIFIKTGMYDGKITKNAEEELCKSNEEYASTIKTISKALRKRKSKIVRNPTSQLNNALLSDKLLETNVLRKLKIKKEWESLANLVKQNNNGVIPGRGAIYKHAEKSHKQKDIKSVADWIFYENVWSTLDHQPTMDYPTHVQKIQYIVDKELIPPKKKVLAEVTRTVEGEISLEKFANVDFGEIVETRDYAKNWWDVIEQDDLNIKEMSDAFRPLYAQMVKISNPSSIGKKTRITFRLMAFAGIAFDGVKLALDMSNPYDISSYGFALSGLAGLFANHIIDKKQKEDDLYRMGHRATSIIEQAVKKISK